MKFQFEDFEATVNRFGKPTKSRDLLFYFNSSFDQTESQPQQNDELENVKPSTTVEAQKGQLSHTPKKQLGIDIVAEISEGKGLSFNHLVLEQENNVDDDVSVNISTIKTLSCKSGGIKFGKRRDNSISDGKCTTQAKTKYQLPPGKEKKTDSLPDHLQSLLTALSDIHRVRSK